MNLHTAIEGRRTASSFTDAPVPDAALDRALRAAVWAPNHKRTWPFSFVVAGPSARAALAELAAAQRARMGVADDAALMAAKTPFLRVGALIVVAQRLAADEFRRREDYATCAIATQHLMLSLHADGFGTKWGTGALTRNPEALTILGLSPGVHDVVGFIYAGETTGPIDAPARPALADLVTRLA